jgi:Ca2+-binding EF-hand superfamily protein
MVSSITLTFQNIITSGVNSGSLADGRWQLSIPALNYTSPLNAIHRLFGDVDGNANVTGNDFLEFGNAFNGASLAFDYDNDGVVTGADLLQFGNRFGVTL